MELQYIDENLKEIMTNLDNIMYIKPYDIENKKALFAVVKEEDGVYKKIQLTRAQSKMSFPFEPIYWMCKGPGYWLLKDYMVFNNCIALNTSNVDGFKYKKLSGSKKFNVCIYATFSDGSATFIKRVPQKEFEKKGGIQSYIYELDKFKDYNPQHDYYYRIENYINESNQIIIPELLSLDSPYFTEVDSQSLIFKDESGNIIESSAILSSSVKEAVKVLSRKKNKR